MHRVRADSWDLILEQKVTKISTLSLELILMKIFVAQKNTVSLMIDEMKKNDSHITIFPLTLFSSIV